LKRRYELGSKAPTRAIKIQWVKWKGTGWEETAERGEGGQKEVNRRREGGGGGKRERGDGGRRKGGREETVKSLGDRDGWGYVSVYGKKDDARFHGEE